MKRSYVVAAALGCAFLGRSASASAAPPKKCIAAAESGQQLRSSGHLIEARKALAACTANNCPAVVRRDCGRWIEEIDAAQPSITVKLEEASGEDAADGRVLVDGEPLLRTGGRATPLDPGVHKLVWVRETGGNIEQEAIIREGERNRLIVLRVALATKPTADTVEPPPPPPPRARGPLPYAIGGVGVALAGAGGIFWGIGLNDRSNLNASCAAAHTCAQHDIDASRTKLIVGDVLMGASVLALAGAIFLFLNHDGSRAVLSGIPGSRPFVVRPMASSDHDGVPVK